MAAALEETPVTYEDLADIERDFDDVETEIIQQQVALTTPLYDRRSQTVSKIPNFWPLVLEQAPPDIDQYIQPSDSALLLSSLLSLSVSHFEIETDPRSVSVRFEFAPNEYFQDTVLEKKFWWRRSRDGWAGLVSEAVPIQWKEGRDLTGGLLGMVIEAEKSTKGSKGKDLTPEQKKLKKKIDNTGMGGLSFFAWFGFIGRRISAEESAEAVTADKEKRKNRQNGKSVTPPQELDQEEDEEDEDMGMDLEIFPDGDDLAIAFTEDLWPGAIKYFTQAQEQDAMSDADFESDDDEDLNGPAETSDVDEEVAENGRPAKKRKPN